VQKEKIKGIALIASIILIGLIAQLYKNSVYENPKVYTIGTIIKLSSTASMEMQAIYSYSLDGKKYKNSQNNFGYKSVANIGRRFLVSIPIGHNNYGVIMFDQPVPDEVKAPVEGWSELPNFDNLK